MHKEISLKARLQLNGSEYMRVGSTIFAYLFHRITQRELLSHLDDRELAERVLEAVRSDGYVLKNCKLYAHAVWCARENGGRVKASDYGIHKEDVALLRRINLAHLSSHYAPMSVEDMDTMIEGALENALMRAHIGKYISKKMTFLIRSYGVPRHDIEEDLKAAAIAAVYKTYPRFETALHFTNVAKAAIHNAGMSLISYHTRSSRTRLLLNEEGNPEAVHVPFDSLSSVEAPEGYMAHAKDSLQTLVKLAPRMSSRVQEFLLALAGHHHAGLSEFMNRNNSDAVDEMQYPKYLEHVQQYFGVTEEQTQKLFRRLRPHLHAV